MNHCCEYNSENLCIHCGREYISPIDEVYGVKEMCCRRMKAAVFYDRVDIVYGAAMIIDGRHVSINYCPWCGKDLYPYIEDGEGAGL